MKIATFLGATALALAVPSITQAQARIEVRAGLDIAETSLALSDDTVTVRGEDSRKGFNYGVEAGYDARVSQNFVLGAYAGIEQATTKDCNEVYGLDRACIRAGRDITVGLRAGSFVGPNTLLYVKGGYTNGQTRLTYDDYENILPDVREHANMDGWHAGAGVEHSFSANTYLKLEYNYTDYANARGYIDDIRVNTGVSRHRVVAGVGMNF